MAMQRRFSLGTYSTFKEAKAEKDKILAENPNNNYQIRRRQKGGHQSNSTTPYSVFDLVQRITSSQADQVIHRAEKIRKVKRHGHHNQSTV